MNRFKWLRAAAMGVLLVGSLAVVGLQSAVFAGGAAQTPQAENRASADQTPVYTGSIQVSEPEGDQAEDTDAPGDKDEQVGKHENGVEDEVDESDSQYAHLAKITADQAAASISKAYPGATFGRPRLEIENGSLVYGAEVTQADGTQLDVKVDAGNGKILSAQSGAEDQEHEDAAPEDVQDDEQGSED